MPSRARPPFTARPPARAQRRARVRGRGSRGVEGLLDAPHAGPAWPGPRARGSTSASPCRCRARPRWRPRACRPCEDGTQELRAPLPVGLEDRQVDVAVADVTASGDERALLLGEGRDHRARNAGIAARGTTASMMSSAPAALATKKAFSRARDQLPAGLGRQHVDVERPQLARAARRGAHVLVQPLRVVVLSSTTTR